MELKKKTASQVFQEKKKRVLKIDHEIFRGGIVSFDFKEGF